MLDEKFEQSQTSSNIIQQHKDHPLSLIIVFKRTKILIMSDNVNILIMFEKQV